VSTRKNTRPKPRILFVSYTAEWTGPTNSLLLLLVHLRTYYRTAVLLPGRGAFSAALTDQRIPFFSLPKLNRRSVLDVARLIRREDFDLVYANSNDSSCRVALIAAKLTGVPFICHVRSMATGKPWFRSGYLNFADAVVTVSDACAAALRGKVLKSKLQVVHNGIDLDAPDVTCAQARGYSRQELGISEERVLLINIGHLMPRKGQEFAVRATAAAAHSGVDINLLLVGSHERDRKYVDAVKGLTGALGIEDRVHLIGFRQDVPALLSLADVYIHTAVSDPHPRAVLEAMATRLPVIAFAVDGVSETVLDGQTGCLISSGDMEATAEAIRKLSSNPALRTKMGNEGRHRVESCFSASVTAEKVARTIDDRLSRRASFFSSSCRAKTC
jgi:glycosyltransferase involved in cell wall biosynthesis